MKLENVKKNTLVSSTFGRSLHKVHEKWAEASEVLHLTLATRNNHHVPKQKRRQFHKTTLSKCSKRRPSSPNTTPAKKIRPAPAST
jgi:hypothetical protein